MESDRPGRPPRRVSRGRLDVLRHDRPDAEAEIRVELNRLAARYDVGRDDLDEAMSAIGLVVGGMTHEAEIGYLAEIDSTPPA